MLTITQWKDNEKVYSIENEQGERVGQFLYETRENYNSVLTVYSNAWHTINAQRLIDLGECIHKHFGKDISFGILDSDLIYKM